MIKQEKAKQVKVRSSRTWNDEGGRIAPVVAITGGIGSGKSSCSAWMARYDIPVVDADIINACLLDTDQECVDEIVDLFGKEALNSRGRINRDALAKRVFADAGQRRQLEAILHPRIKHDAHIRIQEWRRMGAPYILLIVPLLPAVQAEDWPINWTVLVEASHENRIERLRARSWFPGGQAQAILDAQSSAEEYRRVADEIIENNGTLEEFRAKLDDMHERILEKFKG